MTTGLSDTSDAYEGGSVFPQVPNRARPQSITFRSKRWCQSKPVCRLLMVMIAALMLIAPAVALPASPATAVENGIVESAPPWVVRLSQSDGTTGCSGALISLKWVITAAHCLRLDLSKAIVGSTGLDVAQGGFERQLDMTRAVTHPGWFEHCPHSEMESCDYDVALVPLTSDAPSHWETLPLMPTSVGPIIGEGVTLYGYGDTSENEPSDSVHKTIDGSYRLAQRCSGAEEARMLVCMEVTGSSRIRDGDSGAPWLIWRDGWLFLAINSGANEIAAVATWLRDVEDWIRDTADILTHPANTILRDQENENSWLVSGDGFRQWIADGATYNCLLNLEYRVVNLSFAALSQTPDRLHSHAVCDSSAATPPHQGATDNVLSHQIEVAPNGDIWTLMVTSGGTMKVKQFDSSNGAWGAPITLGSQHSWSRTSSPELVVGTDGRVWIAAVSKSGSLYTRSYTNGAWDIGFTRHGSAGSWSTKGGVNMVALPNGGVAWLALSSGGSLYYRTYQNGSWDSQLARHAGVNAWSASSKPGLTVASDDSIWIGAIYGNGSLYTRSYNGSWSGLTKQGGNGWSKTAGVDIEQYGSGGVVFVAVNSSGTLYTRGYLNSSWTSFTKHGSTGGWSSTAEPSLVMAADGRLWLSAIYKNGTLYTRHYAGSWSGLSKQGAAGDWSIDGGADLAPLSANKVIWLAATDDGRLYSRYGNTNAGAWSSLYDHGAGWAFY